MATKAQLAALKKGRETRARNAAKKSKAPTKRKAAVKKKAPARKAPTVNAPYGYIVQLEHTKATLLEWVGSEGTWDDFKRETGADKFEYVTGLPGGNVQTGKLKSALVFRDKKQADTLLKDLKNIYGADGQSGFTFSVKKLNATRARNPVPPSSVAKNLEKAGHLYREFTGHDPNYYDTINNDPIKVGLKVGMVDGVLYTTVRDGIKEHYIHEFKHSSRPTLVASHDGRALALVGGKYRFTDRGIVDQ